MNWNCWRCRVSKITWNFFEENLTEIERIAKETGKIYEIAIFLAIDLNTLRFYRKKYQELELVIERGLAEYTHFTEERLQEIEKIAEQTGSKERVAETLDMPVGSLKHYRKLYPKLEESINKGLEKYRPYTKEQLQQIEKIMQTGYLKDVAKFLNIHTDSLKKYYNMYPELKRVIDKGEKLRDNYFWSWQQSVLKIDFIVPLVVKTSIF